MFSDIILSEGSPFAGNKEFYDRCFDCETKVTTQPADAIRSVRYCIEMFANSILEINGIKLPESNFERSRMGLENAYERIKYCADRKFITPYIEKKLQYARKQANIESHPSTAVTQASILFREFYVALVSYITKKRCDCISDRECNIRIDEKTHKVTRVTYGYDAEDLLPIAYYEIIEPLFDYNERNITKTFLAQKKVTREGRIFTQYAIIKKFIKDSPDDITQNRDTMSSLLIKSNIHSIDNIPILTEDVDTSNQYQYSYLIYLTTENTFILTDSAKRKAFFKSVEGDKHSTIYKRIKVLKEITEVLYSLSDIDGHISIHHRNLRPDSVFITPTRRGGKATLGNFEYSKIIDDTPQANNKLTLNLQAYAKKVENDPFAPPEVKNQSPLLFNNPNWEQVDIYSLAVISLYIIFGEKFAENINMHLNTMRDNLPIELYEITKDILDSPYGSRPTLAEYLDVVEASLAKIN